jgi:2-iminobutanoate/2-iminopropanoate deaminase
MGHYSDAVLAGEMLYVSGCLPIDEAGALVGAGDMAAQAHQVYHNLGLALKAAGCGPESVIESKVYVREMGERLKMNAVRQEFFGEHRPAGTLVEVSALAHPEALIEVDAVALIPS